MKKTYIKPQTKVVILQNEVSILAGSISDSVTFTIGDTEEEGIAD